MILEFLKKSVVYLVATVFVVWVFYQFFTDPKGSADFVSSVFHGIFDAIGSIATFVKALH